MWEDTTSRVKLVAGAAGATLCVALAAVIGIVPGAHDSGEPQNVAATAIPPDPVLPAQAAELPAPPVVTVPPTAPPPPPTTAAPKKASAPRPVTKPAAKAPTAVAPVAASAASAPPTVAVARRQPSRAEVQAAIQGLRQYVSYTPTPAQVAQGADQICTAFDQGQTYDQVKSTALSMVPSFITVRPGAAEYVIHTAVELYCPGHASNLG